MGQQLCIWCVLSSLDWEKCLSYKIELGDILEVAGPVKQGCICCMLHAIPVSLIGLIWCIWHLQQGMVISNEVQKALKEGKPIVALESTIVSHGMPFPQNLETALAVEEVVRENGATPATIAIIQGVPHIGLSQEQLHHIASRHVHSPPFPNHSIVSF